MITIIIEFLSSELVCCRSALYYVFWIGNVSLCSRGILFPCCETELSFV